MTMMAMTNPEALADMQIGMHGFPLIMNLEPNTLLWRNELNVRPFTEDQMIHLQDQLKTLKIRPMDPEQMQKMQDQMKDLQKEYYKGKEKYKEPQTPEAPAAPQAAPAPAPQPPQ
jgi:hypothetical protein